MYSQECALKKNNQRTRADWLTWVVTLLVVRNPSLCPTRPILLRMLAMRRGMRRGGFVVGGRRVATVQWYRGHIVHVTVALRIGGGAGGVRCTIAAGTAFRQFIWHIIIAHHSAGCIHSRDPAWTIMCSKQNVVFLCVRKVWREV